MKYFEQFPIIQYNQYNTRNIIAKVKLTDVLSEDYFSYANYSLKTFDTPWTVAHDYYGTVDRTWLVYMSNKVIDPYYEWYMDQENFEKYIVKKYGSIESAISNIHHYEDADKNIYSVDTYTYADTDLKNSLTGITNYRYEDLKNEDRRNIRLLRYDLASLAETNLKELLD